MTLIKDLNTIFIPDVTNIILDYHIGYDKQIADANHNKKTFNKIMEYIFDCINNPYNCSDHLFPFMYNIHKHHITNIICPCHLSGKYDPLILEYRNKYIEIVGSSSYPYFTEEEEERMQYIRNNHLGYKTYARIYRQNEDSINEGDKVVDEQLIKERLRIFGI
jgi:hypothetical protein